MPGYSGKSSSTGIGRITVAAIAYRNTAKRYPRASADSTPSCIATIATRPISDPLSTPERRMAAKAFPGTPPRISGDGAPFAEPEQGGSPRNPPTIRRRWHEASATPRWVYRSPRNPEIHDAPHHDRSRRVRREEVGEVVHGEARVRDPGAPGPLDHGRAEEGELRLPPVRRLLPAGTGEHRDLLHDEGRQEGGGVPSQARRAVHDADDEGRLGHLRDVQGPGRERVLHRRGVSEPLSNESRGTGRKGHDRDYRVHARRRRQEATVADPEVPDLVALARGPCCRSSRVQAGACGSHRVRREQGERILVDPEPGDAVQESVQLRLPNRVSAVADRALPDMKGRDPDRPGRAVDPRRLLQSAREISAVPRRQAVFEDRLSPGVNAHA